LKQLALFLEDQAEDRRREIKNRILKIAAHLGWQYDEVDQLAREWYGSALIVTEERHLLAMLIRFQEAKKR